MNKVRRYSRLSARLFTLLLLLTTVFAMTAQAQSTTSKQEKKITIRGKVLDEEKIPLVGVTVMVPGTTQGTTIGADGSYSITVPSATKEIEFSFVGMKSERVAINNRTTINITLLAERSEIEAVIVTGYGNITREAYTGSVSVLSASKIGTRAISSIENAIRGNVTGAIVTTTGQPGESSEIRLRGVGSMNASKQPLYVVDGVIWDLDNVSGTDMSVNNPLNALNPSDIESTTILRDAASASLYGSRGANGVIVITTKKGSASRTSISLPGVYQRTRVCRSMGGRENALQYP